ncbi:MAG: flagellar hook-basal body complex protein [Planctomycetes bacterium]|nr:flagellar hook-basal body complex protein [Planctomycetota bacterium]
MALSQALSTGITGLMTHQKAMDNIGNNLANVNTVGYKKGVFQFSTLLQQSLRGGMSADPTTGRGSVNPISIGLGTTTYSINKVFTQGAIENTGNPYDMAIDGNGFFILGQGNGYAYTRAGSFYKGDDGYLMAGNGLYVQGTLAIRNSDGSYTIPQDAQLQDIIIPIGSIGGHSQTSQVGFTGNLDSRQEVSSGTKLYGGTVFPSRDILQAWISDDYNGGNPVTDSKVDHSWNSLESKSYVVNNATLANFGMDSVALPPNVKLYSGNQVMTYPTSGVTAYAAMTTDGRVVDFKSLTDAGGAVRFPNGVEVGSAEWDALVTEVGAEMVPLVEQLKTINGGNVQTSAAYGITVPDPERNANNTQTFPKWFYDSTGGDYEVARNMTDAEIQADPSAAMRAIWPNGFNGEANSWPTSMPRKGETYPASLNTPLEHLQYLKGNVWVQPFANIRNGDSIKISFKKGSSKIDADFTYNKPTNTEGYSGYRSTGNGQSFTLEHFLTFLGGDVDEPTVMAQNITPAMFGAPVTADYPNGDHTAANWDREGFEEALNNVSLASQSANLDSTGGAMGLLSIPPLISEYNGGSDPYDVPGESAGAYTRSGVSTVTYQRWNPVTNSMEDYEADSFNTSFMSNLGSQNALSDIMITYANVPHETMYKAETEYNVAQGGSATMTVDFYDSLGNPKEATVRMAMVSQDDEFTTWRWYADCTDDSDFPWQTDPVTGEIISNLNIGTGVIRFDKNGNFVKGGDYSESGGITINQANQGVNNPIIINILNGLSADTAQDLDFSKLTCSAVANSFKLKSQNGASPGTLDSFVVTADGVIQGEYSNGNKVPIARLAMAIVPNEHGLIAAGNNLYYTSPASGEPQVGHAGEGGAGEILYMQLESSNVDLSEEFTKLISTERGFQANSRTITTSDEMIQELLNLKR